MTVRGSDGTRDEEEMTRSTRPRSFLFLIVFPLLLSLTACKLEQKHELARNREKWQAAQVTDYGYKSAIISSWGANEFMPLSIVVKEGQLISVTDKDGHDQPLEWNTIAGVGAMFEEVEASLSARNRKVEVEYDPTYGFPAHVYIFYNDRGVGGEYSRDYTVSDFEVLAGP
jgi:hypothetical protein